MRDDLQQAPRKDGTDISMIQDTSPPPPVQMAAPGSGLRRSHAGLRTVGALILREMSTRYGRSPGGYVWAVIEPLGTILLLALGFSLIVRAPSLGNNFVLFYASGYLTFNMYQQIAIFVARAIAFSRPLLFYPAVSWVDAVMARFILNALTGLMVSAIILAVILGLAETRATIDVGPVLLGLTLSLAIGFGIGVMNCALIGLYPTWDLIWSIATRPLFLASGIFYVFEDMPRTVQNILWYNPLIHTAGIMRTGIYPSYRPEYVSIPFVMAVSMVTGVLGLMLLRRHHRAILEKG